MATKPTGKPAASKSPPDLKAMAKEFETTLAQLGKDVKVAFERAAEETKIGLEQGVAKAVAKNPALYAQMRRTMAEAKRTVEEAAKQLGLKDL